MRVGDEYVGLYCAEMPDVRFEDIVRVPLGLHGVATAPIDPVFVAVCEPGSIEAVSAVPSSPAVVGARVEGSEVVVERAPSPITNLLSSMTVTVRLSGIRRGFAGERFKRFTQQQALANDRFWAGAHPRD